MPSSCHTPLVVMLSRGSGRLRYRPLLNTSYLHCVTDGMYKTSSLMSSFSSDSDDCCLCIFQCPIVERLTNSLMMHGRNNGKKLMAVRIVKHSFEIIHLLTGEVRCCCTFNVMHTPSPSLRPPCFCRTHCKF